MGNYRDAKYHQVNSVGRITTFAGNGVQGYSGDGGAATSASLNAPCNILVSTSGDVYIADSSNNAIRKVCVTIIACESVNRIT